MKSVDLQTLLPKIPEVSRVQQVQDQEPQARQHQEAVQVQQRSERVQKQVNLPPKSYRVEDREKGGGSGSRRQRQSRQPAREKPVQGPAGGQGKNLDILV